MKNILIILVLLIFFHPGYAQTTPLTAGTIGLAQEICYNTAPAKLYQLTTPAGGSGSYKYQWQNSSNNSTWRNITGATLSGYTPPALKTNTWYRLRVTSGTFGTVSTNSVQIKVFANLTAGSIGTASSVCYNTTPAPLTQVTAPKGGTGTYTYQWQSSQDNTNWINIAGANSPGYTPAALTSTTYFRRNVTSGSCGSINSASIRITVLPQITLAQLRDNITINSNTSTNINVAVTGGTSPFSINYTRNGVAQAAVNSYTSGTNIPTGILTTGVYNYALTSVIDARGCSAQSLGTGISVIVTDNVNLTAGSVGTAQSVCYNTAPAQLTQITAPTGGTGTYTFQWQSSANNSVWTNISGATLSGYSPPALTASTYFRRTVSSGSYTPVNSTSVLITVSPQITLAQLRDNITINSNTSANINVAVTGGTSPFSINYTRNGVAQAAVNSYVSGTNIPTGILTTGIYNYALTSVTDARGCVAQDLGTNISVTVIDKPVSLYVPVDSLFRTQTPAYSSNDSRYELGSEFQTLSAGFITKVRLFSNINEGGDHIIRLWILNGSTYTMASGPYTWNFTSGIHGWRSYSLSSPVAVEANKTYIISISNGTDMNYEKSENFQSSTNSLYVRYTRGVYTTSIGSVPTSTYVNSCYFRDVVFSITNANGNLTAGIIGSTQSVCYNTAPAQLTQITAPTGGTGTYTFQWQSSSNNSVWTNISGATLSGYSPTALTANTYFRRTVSSGSYTPVNSTPVLITVSPQITLAQLRDNITINSNTSTNINVAVTGGISPFSINYTRNGVAQAAVNSYVSGTNIPTGILTTGVYNYALTSVIDARGCSAQSLGTGISVIVTDNVNLTAGSVGTAQSVCYNTAPAQLTQITAPTGGTGTYTFQWQSSANNSVWTNISGATLSGYSPTALTASTYFRRTVSSGSYTPVNSTSVLITVSPQITLAQLRDNITINSNTSANINVAVTGGTSPFSINYTRNGVAQAAVNSYVSGTNIPTGILTTGIYNYALTSVTDARGCVAQDLGTNISVTVIDKPVSLYVPVDSLFRTQTPAYSSNDSRYELGSEFQTLSAGFITKVRLFSNINEGGDHIIRLWILNGSTYTMAAGPYTWNFTSGIHGWRSYSLSSPVAVEANKTYIISISNGTDMNYEKSENFQSSTNSLYVRYTRGVYTTSIGSVPTSTYVNSCYFRDVVFSITNANGNLTAGIIGSTQSVCYNTAPAQLTQITAPTGGTGTYTFQWQSSSNNSVWTNISGATLSGYSPTALTANTYFRRTVSSGSYTPVNSTPVLITVSPQITLAQLHDNTTIFNNTSTSFNVVVTGGTTPFAIDYALNGIAQSAINNYSSGTNISTGVLTNGAYEYVLTSVTDASGCPALSLGTGISVIVSENQDIVINSNKALVLVNSASAYYSDYVNYINPYLENFGIPYDLVNINSTQLPDLSDYAVIIFGHKNVYNTGYPIAQLEASVSGGAGLYSFDPHLFDFQSGFNTLITQKSVSSSQISISNSTHYITQLHAPDTYNQSNNLVNLLESFTLVQNSRLTGGVDLATMSSNGNNVTLLQVTNYGNGKIVKWCGYDWVFENILGPVYGMDDLIWRGIVWAARKPFVMQGLPPMITMRVDDVQGNGGNILNNFEWITISNEFGIIPWCGTFNRNIPTSYIPTLKSLIDNNKVTASPHGYGSDAEFIYFNHYGESPFDPVANARLAKEFYDHNGLKISKYFIPHYYEISSSALPEIKTMGGEFIGIHMLPDNTYYNNTRWIHCGPYRLNNDGPASNETWPVYYAGYVNFNGLVFFNCITEIRDDGTYEWYPDNNVTNTSARGIRHLRRALNSMVLPSLFTHEYFFDAITSTNFREILRQITTSVSGYNPEYTSTDYAIQYIRAKTNIKITNIREMLTNIEISYAGNNDLDTKCYLFTEQNGQIIYRFVGLPQINGSSTVNVIK